MKKFVCAAFVAAVLSTPALAADFSGPYAGIGATVDNVQGSGPLEGFGTNGVGATAFAGYDMALGNTFIGIEANADLNTADVAGIKAKWGWGASVRTGYKLNESTGVYARAGYQRNKVSGGGASAWGEGVRLGGGLETGISSNVSLRAEFNHVNYEFNLINNQGVVALVFGF
jgi:outer membrane immunogenic protein